MTNQAQPAVVVTGASTGIGKTIALALDAGGFRVFAGVRKEADGEKLRREAGPCLTPLLLDVTDDSSIARAALGGLCESYWYPVYAMVRRYGHDPTNAEDLTQAYFTRFLEKSWVKEVSPEHGRFRSFLLVSVRNFLNNETDRERALKRGGGQRLVELDGVTAERRYALEPVESSTPETLFERAWAEHVLARTLERLQAEVKEMFVRDIKFRLGALKGQAEPKPDPQHG